MRRPCADALNVERNADLAGLLEFQRHRHLATLFERMLDVRHHQMIAARRERHGLARRDGQSAFDRMHFHHAIVHEI